METSNVLLIGGNSIGGNSISDGLVDNISIDDNSIISISTLEFNLCFSASIDMTMSELYISTILESDTTSLSNKDIPMMDDLSMIIESIS